MKRINADFYTEDKYVGPMGKRRHVYGENDTLFAYGIYPTKIKKEDLPDWYVYDYSSGGYRYFKTKGIVDLAYVPCYDNHPLKYDRLYISFKKKININNVENETWLKQEEYDYLIWNHLIVAIVIGAEKYSNLDVNDIKKAIDLKQYYFFVNEDKDKWYRFFEEVEISEEEKIKAANYQYFDSKMFRSKKKRKQQRC